MSRRTRNRAARGVCPTCGCSWKPYAAPRKGGRRYAKKAQQSYGPHWARTPRTAAARVTPQSRQVLDFTIPIGEPATTRGDRSEEMPDEAEN